MQRGFKSRCENISARYRKNFGLHIEDPFPYRKLAESMGILIWTPADVPGLSPKHLKVLTESKSSEWSAVTITVGLKSLIIVNSSHSESRLANDITHELAHIILDHSVARLDVSDDGHMWLKTYDKEQEAEADWLAASLLLPREGVLRVYRRKRNVNTVASTFEVSKQLATMRINVTGINRQLPS